MTDELSRSAQEVQAVLAALGMGVDVPQSHANTRTPAKAAAAIGCAVAQIDRSIVFRIQSPAR